MGFYSFYKIIKDMLRTLFGTKILKIIIIVLLFFIILSIKQRCFGVVIDTTPIIGHSIDVDLSQYNNKNYTLSLVKTTNNQIQISVGFSSVNSCTYHPIDTDHNRYRLTFFNNTAGSSSAYTTDSDLISRIQSAMSLANGNYTTTPTSTIRLPLFNINPVFYTNNMTIYNPDGSIYYSSYIPPSLSNTQTQLENLSFNDFIINANSFTQDMISNPDEPLVMLFYNRSLSNSNSTDGLYPIKEKYFYKESIYFDNTNSTDTNYIFKYPIFKTGVFFNIGSTYEIKFAKRVYIQEYNTWGYDYFDTNYVFTISSNVTQDYINQLNQQTATSIDEDNQQKQLVAINNQTQSIDNINNSITDSNVDNSSINLPTDNTNDPTQSGVDNIFQIIYNSFTSGTPQDIVFPIPNTNKNITLSATYVADSLRNNNASWVIDIIQAFYWYIISRYIIVDIMQKVRKIKQGNLDNIENSNIKEDML